MKFTYVERMWGVGVVLLAVLGCSLCKDNKAFKIEANMLIEIPGGRFRMGLEEELADEILNKEGWLGNTLVWEMPAHEVEVAPFHISQTPVTNAEYAEFVNTGGYANKDFWRASLEEEAIYGGSTPEDFERWFVHSFEKWFARLTDSTNKALGPSTWKNGKPPPGKELHPVSGVSFHEAAAYCAFKGWRLPTEAEWEFAARGTDGRIYPWGNEFDVCRCANRERNGSDTVPVNTLREGQSPFGVLHMSGNVAEWVAGFFGPYPGNELLNEELIEREEGKRIARNTFGGHPAILRASYRVARNADDRPPGFGFRCAK